MDNDSTYKPQNIIQNINFSGANIQQLNNGVQTVTNYFGVDKEQQEQSKTEEPKEETAVSPFESMKEPEENIDCTPIRTEILNYVSRIRPFVAPDKRDRYMKMWEGILELDVVKPYVYKTGKQKETNFNRKLIANILRHLDTRRMYKDPYKASDLAVALEGGYAKSVRGELGKFPSDYTCAEINKYLETLGL